MFYRNGFKRCWLHKILRQCELIEFSDWIWISELVTWLPDKNLLKYDSPWRPMNHFNNMDGPSYSCIYVMRIEDPTIFWSLSFSNPFRGSIPYFHGTDLQLLRPSRKRKSLPNQEGDRNSRTIFTFLPSSSVAWSQKLIEEITITRKKLQQCKLLDGTRCVFTELDMSQFIWTSLIVTFIMILQLFWKYNVLRNRNSWKWTNSRVSRSENFYNTQDHMKCIR